MIQLNSFMRQGWKRFLVGLLALYLLNISVDFQHPRIKVREDISINEIESLAELVVEEIAQVEDFFEELPESDREPIVKVNFSLIYLVSGPLVLPVRHGLALQSDFAERTSCFINLTPSILTPPPQIV